MTEEVSDLANDYATNERYHIHFYKLTKFIIS